MVNIIRKCYDNNNYFTYIYYIKNNKKYIMIKRKIKSIFIIVSNTEVSKFPFE